MGILPDLNALERGRLHQVMVLARKPATWSLPLLAVALLFLAVVASVAGWLSMRTTSMAWRSGSIFAASALLDAVILSSLPRLRLSFGEWRSHVMVLAVTRLVVHLPLLGFASFLSPFLATILLLLAQMSGTVLLVWGSMFEPFRIQLTQLKLENSRFERPWKLLHITDLHVERLTIREAKLLSLAQSVCPDVIVLTGDYLNLSYVEDPVAFQEVRALLSRLEAPHGVFATLGTPQLDIRGSIEQLFEGLDIRLLRNEHKRVVLPEGRQMNLIGIDCNHDPTYDGDHLMRLARDLPKEDLSILLYHSPDLMPLASSLPLDLYLCGHTHGGQVRLPGYGALLTSSIHGKRYEMGHYIENGTHLFVSRGIGMEGYSAPRVRLFCPPEITLIELA